MSTSFKVLKRWLYSLYILVEADLSHHKEKIFVTLFIKLIVVIIS